MKNKDDYHVIMVAMRMFKMDHLTEDEFLEEIKSFSETKRYSFFSSGFTFAAVVFTIIFIWLQE